jgi:hypothetical protein
MPVASATAEISFSVLRRLKTYVRSTMKNDRLSSLELMHINRDFKVDLCKAMEVFISAKAGQILGNFKTFLSIKVIKIVLDSILYKTMKWPQIAPFCISSKKKNPRPPPPLKNYGVHTINPQLRPWSLIHNTRYTYSMNGIINS